MDGRRTGVATQTFRSRLLDLWTGQHPDQTDRFAIGTYENHLERVYARELAIVKIIPVLTILRRRDYALFWSGQLISSIGNWVLWIALPFYVYERTGSALATGIMLIVRELPPVLLGSLAGVFVDRWGSKQVVVTSSLLQALVLLLLLLDKMWMVYLGILCQSLTLLFSQPALGVLTPRLVDEHELMAANNLNTFGSNLASLVGPSLGGLLSVRLEFPGVVFVRCATLIVSAVLIGLITGSPGVAEAQAGADSPAGFGAWKALWLDWLAGLRLVRRVRIVGDLFAVMGLVMLGQGFVNVLWVIFVRDVLGGGEPEYGWVQVAVASGALVGGPILARVSQRLSPGRLIGISGALVGLLLLATFNLPFLPAILAFQFLVGIPAVGFSVTHRTLLQSSTDDRYLGRVLGALNTTNSLLVLGGQVLASLLGDRVGVVPLLNLAGFLYLPVAIIALVRLPGRTER